MTPIIKAPVDKMNKKQESDKKETAVIIPGTVVKKTIKITPYVVKGK